MVTQYTPGHALVYPARSPGLARSGRLTRFTEPARGHRGNHEIEVPILPMSACRSLHGGGRGLPAARCVRNSSSWRRMPWAPLASAIALASPASASASSWRPCPAAM
jgi:hypothetical protein